MQLRLLGQLAAFDDGAPLDAVEQLVGDAQANRDGAASAPTMADVMTLVDAGLLVAGAAPAGPAAPAAGLGTEPEPGAGLPPRYLTARAVCFVDDWPATERAAALAGHDRFYAWLAHACGRALDGPGEAAAAARLAGEQVGLRAALRRRLADLDAHLAGETDAAQHGRRQGAGPVPVAVADAAIELAAALAEVASRRGADDWLEHAVAGLARHLAADRVGTSLAPRQQVRLLIAGAQTALVHGEAGGTDAGERRGWLARAVEVARRSGDPDLLLLALERLGASMRWTRDVAASVAAAREGLVLAEATGSVLAARFRGWVAAAELRAGDAERALSLGRSALTESLRRGDERGVLIAGLLLHSDALPAERLPDELPDLAALETIARRLDDPHALSPLLALRAWRAALAGDWWVAARVSADRLDLLARRNLWHSSGYSVIAMAVAASSRGEHAMAARLAGALAGVADALTAAVGDLRATGWHAALELTRAELGPTRFDEAFAAGRSGGIEGGIARTVQYCRRLLALGRAAGSAAAHTGALSAREREVLDELVAGGTNKQIALRLGISSRTVTQHCVAIYRKLGVSGRAGAVAVAVREGWNTTDGT